MDRQLASFRNPALLVGFWLICTQLACADGTPPRPDLGIFRGPASVVVINRSQFELQELRIHQGSNYLEHPNLLDAPLQINEELVFYEVDSWYLTVIRERYKNGPVLAYSLADPIELITQKGYTLEIFDESFRLSPVNRFVKPHQASNAVKVIGMTDGGPNNDGGRDRSWYDETAPAKDIGPQADAQTIQDASNGPDGGL